jgi:hypothetical protein
MKPTWTDAHERLLGVTVPPVPEVPDAEVERVWARVGPTLDQHVPARRRGRRLRVGIAAGVSAAVLGTSGLAVADLYTARTGEGPVDAEDLRLGGPGEKLALAAPDFGEVVAEETADVPFPTSEARTLAVRDQVHDARSAGTDEFVSTGAIRAWVSSAAVCAWANRWAAATRSGAEDERAEAIEMIQAAPTWPAIVAIIPSAPEPYVYLDALGRAVEGRRTGPVARLLAAHNGYCRPGLVPDLPHADPMNGSR